MGGQQLREYDDLLQDDGSPQQSSTMMLTVHVTDGDDQGPVFVYPGCFTYLNRCAWPKYTASNVLKQVSS